MSETQPFDLPGADPMEVLSRWFAEADAQAGPYADAVALATTDAQGHPHVRMVLRKAFDARGLVFYTNLESNKGRQISEVPRAATVCWWPALGRQARLEGVVARVTDAEADAYFASRPRGAQLGAWASAQSRPLAGREVLTEAVAELDARYRDQPVPRPPHWTGLRLSPEVVELWIDRRDRLHDRFRYERVDGRWRSVRLAP